MENKYIYIIGFGIIAALVIGTLAYGAANGFDFGGSDDSGGEIAPGIRTPAGAIGTFTPAR